MFQGTLRIGTTSETLVSGASPVYILQEGDWTKIFPIVYVIVALNSGNCCSGDLYTAEQCK